MPAAKAQLQTHGISRCRRHHVRQSHWGGLYPSSSFEPLHLIIAQHNVLYIPKSFHQTIP